jgi:DNA ligase (NAD+)
VVPTATNVFLYLSFHSCLNVGEVVNADTNLPPKKLYPKGCVAMIDVPTQKLPQTLAGLTFVVTGGLNSFTRYGIAQTIADHGGKASSSVSKKTDYVLVGADPGSKLAKAQELGVAIIDEDQFKALLAKDLPSK